MTTRTGRTTVTTTFLWRVKPIKYIELLQDDFDSVEDLDWGDIYVYADTWIAVSWTEWTWRILIT